MKNIAVGIGLFVCSAVWSAEPRSAMDWLDSMNRAFTELSYDGVFSYYTGDDLATLRVIHKIIDGQQRERLVHLNGAPREIVRHGNSVACVVMPGDKLLELESSIPAGPFARAFVRDYNQVSSQYKLHLGGTERVVGRQAQRLDIVPMHADRFGFSLWLDVELGFLLRSEMLDARGKRLEIFQFTHILFGDAVSDAALEASEHEGSMVSHLTLSDDTSNASPGALAWHAGWLPPGFAMAASDIRRTPTDLKAVSTMVYSDGLAAFTVFVEDMPERGAGQVHARNGATVAINSLVDGPSGRPHLVTLVGELPDSTAKQILAAVAPSR